MFQKKHIALVLFWNVRAEIRRRSASLTASLRTDPLCCSCDNGLCWAFSSITSFLRAMCGEAGRCEELGSSLRRAARGPWRSGHWAAAAERVLSGGSDKEGSTVPATRPQLSLREYDGYGFSTFTHFLSSRRPVQLFSNLHIHGVDGIVATLSCFCDLPVRLSGRAICLWRKSGALSRSGS